MKEQRKYQDAHDFKTLRKKVITKTEAKYLSDRLKEEGKKIVFTNGCFDIIHMGHVKLLCDAKTFGDVLLVGLNSDESVRRIKGKGRPVINQDERACTLAALKPVDWVVIFEEDTPLELIKTIQPDILVKGTDWSEEDIVGADLVRLKGGRVVRVEIIEGLSTSNIIKRIREGAIEKAEGKE